MDRIAFNTCERERILLEKTGSKRNLGVMEVFDIAGFSFSLAWAILSFFWGFGQIQTDYLASYWLQFAAFAGIVAGYLLVHFKTRKLKTDKYSVRTLLLAAFAGVVLPLLCTLDMLGIDVGLPVFAVVSVLAGMSAAYQIVCWLDICSRTRIRSLFLCVSLSFTFAAILALIGCIMPDLTQPLTGVAYAVVGIGCLHFAATRAYDLSERAYRKFDEAFRAKQEVEPALVLFGFIFGFSCVYVMTFGRFAIILVLISVLIGSLMVVLLSWVRDDFNIVYLHRFELCVIVAACLIMPFVPNEGKIACLCVVAASWAGFTAMGFCILTRACMAEGLSVTYHVSAGLVAKMLGMTVGVGASIICTAMPGAPTWGPAVQLTIVFLLVLTTMVFFPEPQHHNEGMFDESQNVMNRPADAPVDEAAPGGMDEEARLRAQCAAFAKMYQLSPRESEILIYLAKGRNAEYIQNKFYISSNTAKSHIYNIYKKSNIHSQQKLMSFIEDLPVDGQSR